LLYTMSLISSMIWVYVLIYATDKLLVIVICYVDTLASVFMTVPSSQLATTTLAEYSSFFRPPS